MIRMEMSSHFIYAYLCGIVALTVLVNVHAQSQPGFISIDCGMPVDTRYVETTTGVEHVSDLGFIDSDIGVSKYISLDYYSAKEGEQFYTVRSFPDGVKNCYTLKPTQGKSTKYLIRARFLHGSYDESFSVPGFDLYLGANKWGSVKLESISTITTMEIIHIPSSENIFVCLVNTGHGTPFISTLELRPLKSLTYSTSQAILVQRLDMGSKSNKTIRYKDDAYDRIWKPFNFENSKAVSTSLTVDPNTSYEVPSSVMVTAAVPANASSPLTITIRPDDPKAQYFAYLHFAEVEKLGANESREFNIEENGKYWQGPFSPCYLDTTTFASYEPVSGEEITYQLIKTETSTLPPILNALEIYSICNFTEPQTDEQDVEFIMKIKTKYGLKKNWQGDPCSPKAFMWEGLNCSFDDPDPLRVTSLNLSSSGLTGQISSYISDLTMLQYLDLSNNNLSGSVPDFLSKLQFLKALDLRGNKLTGSVPVDLIERTNSGSLLLSVSGNPNLKSDFGTCSSPSCQKRKHKSTNFVPIIASVATVLILLIASIIGWTLMKRRKEVVKAEKVKAMRKIGSALEPKSHQFTYSEIIAITNDFERVVGKGGFGTVYHGYLNDSPVAVKMLSEKSAQGYKEFQAEVKLLMRVHHVNLTSLIGYCYEDNCMALIYEYMANGNLTRHLSDKCENTLSWEDRIRIAVDAAQGLEYLHHGCKPPIVHRDVKTANILLNEKFQAKIADFGLSRAFSIEGDTQLSTAVAGTPGYLDPEYFQNNLLNDKSDVYSFGVVLLEIVTSRPVFIRTDDHVAAHISRWFSTVLDRDVNNVVDPKLQGDFDIKSAWKAVEIATACLLQSSFERPTMSQVVTELKECLAMEISSKKDGSREIDSLGGNVDSTLYTLQR